MGISLRSGFPPIPIPEGSCCARSTVDELLHPGDEAAGGQHQQDLTWSRPRKGSFVRTATEIADCVFEGKQLHDHLHRPEGMGYLLMGGSPGRYESREDAQAERQPDAERHDQRVGGDLDVHPLHGHREPTEPREAPCREGAD